MADFLHTCVCMFAGMSPLSTEVTVSVKVIDKSMPIFDKQFYSVSVPENIEIHSHLSVSIKAESSLTRKLIYSISNGNTMEQFAIDFNTGKKEDLLPSVLSRARVRVGVVRHLRGDY